MLSFAKEITINLEFYILWKYPLEKSEYYEFLRGRWICWWYACLNNMAKVSSLKRIEMIYEKGIMNALDRLKSRLGRAKERLTKICNRNFLKWKEKIKNIRKETEYPRAVGAFKNDVIGVLFWCNRLRIWHCHYSGLGCYCGVVPTPGSSNIHMLWVWPKIYINKIKRCNIWIMALPGRQVREKTEEGILEPIMTKQFPKCVTDSNPHIQEDQEEGTSKKIPNIPYLV